MSRAWKISLAGLGSALLLTLLIYYWLLHSTSGAAWLWKQVGDLTAGAVQSSRIEGDLASGFTVEGFKYVSDTVEVSVDSVGIQAGPGWWPVSVQVHVLTLQDVEILTRSVEEQPGGAEPAMDTHADIHAILTELKLPIPVEVHKAVLTNIQLLADEHEAVTRVETLSLQLTLDEQLRIESLQLQAADIEASLQGHLVLTSPFDLSVLANGSFGIDGETGESWQVFPFELEASGNLERLQFSLGGLINDLKVNGELLELAGEPSWDFKGELKYFQWPLNGPDDLIGLSDLMLVSQGNINAWSVDLESVVEYDVFKSTALRLSGSGSATGMQITGLTLIGAGLDLEVDGELGWSAQPQAVLHTVIRQLDLSPWLEEWPAGKYLAGDMHINWSESGLKIPAGRLTVPGTELAVNIEADIDDDANTIDTSLQWSGLNWPLASATPDFSSHIGKLRIKGNLDQWKAAGQVDIQLGDYPQGHFDIQGEGNRASAHLTIPGGEALGGSVSGEVSADWANGLSWDAYIHALGVDPAPLLPGWPGRLDAEARISAQSEMESIQIKLLSLEGMLRGVPLDAKGGLNIEGDSMTFIDFGLQTDEALLQLDGSTSRPTGVAVKFSGHLPSVLLDGASGNVELEASYSSDHTNPLLDLHMEALDLAWNGIRIRSMSLDTQETNSPAPVPAFELEASQLSWQDALFDELSLSLSPAGERQQLKANLMKEDIMLSTAMTLAPADTDDLIGGPWSGVLDELAMKVRETYFFELLEPAALAWSADSAQFGPLCLRESRGAGLCLDGQYQNNGDWSLDVDASAIPLDYLRDIFDLDVQFEQMIEGHFEWHQPHGKAPTGGAEFRITAGRVLDTDDKESLVESNEGKLEFVLQNGNLESGTLDIDFPGVGFIDFDFEVQNLMEFGARRLSGRALAKLSDIKLIGELAFPGIDDLSGSFESNIQLGGTLSDPSFDGGFKLTNGLIQYSPLGFKLEDIGIDGYLEKRDRGKLEGRFRAGEGIGTVAGNLFFKDMDSMQMQLGLSGDQLLLINTGSLKIIAETDLKLEVSPQRMDINGHIRVPTARLTPANLLLGGITDSEDLIIETPNGALKPTVNEPTPESRVFGELEVAFGDDVLIKVPGVETTFSGSVVYRWNGDRIPLAEGNYMLRGNVDIYGPRLLINNGQISFPNVPANNPLLNIRAGRDIFGNTQINSAGVQLTGTLKRPVLKAYTIPLTNEDRAWTVLVTGTDFDQAQGVSGFDVGTYIAPKLYVSYGISLFEDENVISARYDLKKGFGIKVTSGQRETGVDVSYTIDR